MASRVHIVLEDDLDGSLADSTVQFAFDGTEYEIDLSQDNLAALRATLEPYISAGRKVGGRGRRRVKPAGNRSAEIRAWAAANGIEVSSRGRIPAGIAAQYDAAHA